MNIPRSAIVSTNVCHSPNLSSTYVHGDDSGPNLIVLGVHLPRRLQRMEGSDYRINYPPPSTSEFILTWASNTLSKAPNNPSTLVAPCEVWKHWNKVMSLSISLDKFLPILSSYQRRRVRTRIRIVLIQRVPFQPGTWPIGCKFCLCSRGHGGGDVVFFGFYLRWRGIRWTSGTMWFNYWGVLSRRRFGLCSTGLFGVRLPTTTTASPE